MTLRRTGFGRHEIVRTPQPLYAPVERRGSYTGATRAAAPKSTPARNPQLLAMACGMPCLLRVPGVCNSNPCTVVAAHSNLSTHGKAGARKADDQYHVHACSACHQWLDQGPAPATVKEAAFMRAHLAMVELWRGIAAGFDYAPPASRAAAQWALDRLNATPTGEAP